MALNGSAQTYIGLCQVAPLEHVVVVHSIFNDTIVIYFRLEQFIVLHELSPVYLAIGSEFAAPNRYEAPAIIELRKVNT